MCVCVSLQVQRASGDIETDFAGKTYGKQLTPERQSDFTTASDSTPFERRHPPPTFTGRAGLCASLAILARARSVGAPGPPLLKCRIHM